MPLAFLRSKVLATRWHTALNLFTNTFPVHFLRKTFIAFIHEFQRVPSKCVLAIFANVSAPGSSVGCTCQADGQRGLTGSQNQQTPVNCWLPQGSSYDNFSSSSNNNRRNNSNDTNHNHHKAVAIAVDYDELLPEMSLPCGVFAAWLHLCVPIFLFIIIIFVFVFVFVCCCFPCESLSTRQDSNIFVCIPLWCVFSDFSRVCLLHAHKTYSNSLKRAL